MMFLRREPGDEANPKVRSKCIEAIDCAGVPGVLSSRFL